MSEIDDTISPSAGRPFYACLAIGGLITIFVTMVVLGIAQLASGDTEMDPGFRTGS